jgi:nucleotide-binding universal stress UspA family protein
MFHKILVALDKSECRKQVFNEAMDLAKTSSASLKLLHVLSDQEQNVAPTLVSTNCQYYQTSGKRILEICEQRWETYEDQSLELLRSLKSQADEIGVTVEIEQCSGTPGKIICDVARTWEADLIIVGRRGYSGVRELFVGSVSNYVLHHAPCSVLTVQGSMPEKTEVNEGTASVSSL